MWTFFSVGVAFRYPGILDWMERLFSIVASILLLCKYFLKYVTCVNNQA
jgi:hypothetical protein